MNCLVPKFIKYKINSLHLFAIPFNGLAHFVAIALQILKNPLNQFT